MNNLSANFKIKSTLKIVFLNQIETEQVSDFITSKSILLLLSQN